MKKMLITLGVGLPLLLGAPALSIAASTEAPIMKAVSPANDVVLNGLDDRTKAKLLRKQKIEQLKVQEKEQREALKRKHKEQREKLKQEQKTERDKLKLEQMERRTKARSAL